MPFINMSPGLVYLALFFLHLCVITSGSIRVEAKVGNLQRRNLDTHSAQESAPGGLRNNAVASTEGDQVAALPAQIGANPQAGATTEAAVNTQGGLAPQTTSSTSGATADQAVITKSGSKAADDPASTSLPNVITVPVLSSNSTMGGKGNMNSTPLQDATGRPLVFPIMDMNGHVVLQNASDIRSALGIKTENFTIGTLTRVNSDSTDAKGEKFTKTGAKGGAGRLSHCVSNTLLGSISLALIFIFLA